jgi:hypothetical protein
MPCSDGGGFSHNDHRLAGRVDMLEKRLDERTAQLCEVLKIIESKIENIYAVLPQNIRDWHEEHKKHDENVGLQRADRRSNHVNE